MTAYSADLLLDNVDEEGKVPERRLKNAAAARELFHKMRRDDSDSSLMRARHQAMLDGEPPYNAAVLQATGQGGRTNVNWGDAEAVMSSVMSGMIDLNVSVETLVKIPLKRSAIPDDETRANLENTLSEEASRCIRGWEGYDFAYQMLAHYCFGHGVGVAYWQDCKDWRWNVSWLSEFMVPRGTRASESKVPVAGLLYSYELHEIYAMIRNEERAEKAGWNVKAVKKAMLRACPEWRDAGYSASGWEKLQEQLRNNDYGTSGRTEKVKVIHMWVQEFDGKVSVCLVSEDALGSESDDDWLYENRNMYDEMRQAFVAFTYGIGDHGTFHSISGILRKIFPQVQAANRAQCQMLDAVGVGTSIILQPTSEQAYQKMNLVSMGGICALPSSDHFDVVERAMPNIAQGAMPVIADLRNTIGRRTGQFQGDTNFQSSGQEKTRYQVQVEVETLGKVGATQANLWYVSWGRLLKETVRRMTRKNYVDKEPGGREVAAFHERLRERGFPLEYLAHIDIDGVKAVRAVGAGSGAARTATLMQLSELAGEYDAVGKYNLTRDRTAAALGGSYDLADRYAPRREGSRPPIDLQFAILENESIQDGAEIPVVVNQLHVVHLDTHLPFLVQIVRGVDEAQIPIDEESVGAMTRLQRHCVEHLGHIQEDPVIAGRVAEYRRILQNLSETILNSQKHLEAEQRKAMEEGAEQQAQGGELPQEYKLKLLESELKLQAMDRAAQIKSASAERQAQAKLVQGQREFDQRMLHKDAETAGKLVTDQKITDAKVESAKRISDAKAEAAKKNKPKPTDKKPA